MSQNKDQGKEKKLSDVFMKVVNTGLNAAIQGEEAIRSKLSDLPLSKDSVQNLVSGIVDSAKQELIQYVQKINISNEIDRILKDYEFQIQATVNFKKKEDHESESKKSDSAKSSKTQK